jgi:hypothetical protein
MSRITNLEKLAFQCHGKFFFCGGCYQYHPLGWSGDCRDNDHRVSGDEMDAHLDWLEVDEGACRPEKNMKRLYIPKLGDILTLAAPWKITIYNESRNESLIKYLGKCVDGGHGFPLGQEPRGVEGPDYYNWYQKSKERFIKTTLSKGSKLRVDRIYIRKGQDGYDSLTFFLIGAATEPETQKRTAVRHCGLGGKTKFDYEVKVPKRPVRFWVKLDEVNTMRIK